MQTAIPESFVVVDLETTGLHPEQCSILSIGAVVPATGEEFYAECRARDHARVEPDALRLNGCTFERVHDARLSPPAEIVKRFAAWCDARGLRLLGGMNPRFDLDFLKAEWNREQQGWFPLTHRTVDLHTLGWARGLRLHFPGGLPGSGLATDAIYASFGLPTEPMPHNALTGARCEAVAFKLLLDGGAGVGDTTETVAQVLTRQKEKLIAQAAEIEALRAEIDRLQRVVIADHEAVQAGEAVLKAATENRSKESA